MLNPDSQKVAAWDTVVLIALGATSILAPLDVAFNAGGRPAHTPGGEPIWDDEVVAATENKTEVLEAVKLCALANASLSINYSPWAYIWGSSPLYCPTGPTNCDPTIGGVGEEL